MEAKNVDDVLVASQAEQLANLGAKQPNDNHVSAIEHEEHIEPTIQQEVHTDKSNDQVTEVKEDSSKEESSIDEYGNPIEKPKMYSEDEVNKLIRDRLSRGKYAEQPQQQQSQQPQQQNQTNEEDWETQLSNFVEKTIDTREKKLHEQKWREQERVKQDQFEEKFRSGMGKYSDFREVVGSKNITETMLLATRDLENPAAFFYGAAKLHGAELDRISKIQDPYAQSSELGRLHERMVKSKTAVSNAPKPLDVITSDMPAKHSGDLPSIDDRISQHANRKFRRR